MMRARKNFEEESEDEAQPQTRANAGRHREHCIRSDLSGARRPLQRPRPGQNSLSVRWLQLHRGRLHRHFQPYRRSHKHSRLHRNRSPQKIIFSYGAPPLGKFSLGDPSCGSREHSGFCGNYYLRRLDYVTYKVEDEDAQDIG